MNARKVDVYCGIRTGRRLPEPRWSFAGFGAVDRFETNEVPLSRPVVWGCCCCSPAFGDDTQPAEKPDRSSTTIPPRVVERCTSPLSLSLSLSLFSLSSLAWDVTKLLSRYLPATISLS